MGALSITDEGANILTFRFQGASNRPALLSSRPEDEEVCTLIHFSYRL